MQNASNPERTPSREHLRSKPNSSGPAAAGSLSRTGASTRRVRTAVIRPGGPVARSRSTVRACAGDQLILGLGKKFEDNKMRATRIEQSAGCARVRLRSMTRVAIAALAAYGMGALAHGKPASAHGIAGDRVFPATIVIDDPAVGDELSFPTFSTIHNSENNGAPGSREFDFGAEWDKTITEDLGVNFNFDYTRLNFDDGTHAEGWQNPVFTLKYKIYVNPEHEFMT